MECYQRCVEAGKRCAFLKSPGSCADCGKACPSNFLITSRPNCRCDTTPVCGQSKTPVPNQSKSPATGPSKTPEAGISKTTEPGQSAKGEAERPSSHGPGKVQQEDKGEEKQTWWQWFLSLFGFGGQKDKTLKDKTTYTEKSRQFQADAHKPIEVISPQAILAEAKEICDEIKKQQPEPYHTKVEQATSPVAQTQKEEKSSETELPKKKKKHKKKSPSPSPPRSPNREKYLGKPLDSSPKSPRTSPKRSKSKSPSPKGSHDKTEKPELSEEQSPTAQVTTPVHLEAKKPPTSPIFSSERYLQPYTAELCPADEPCLQCCTFLSASTQTFKPTSGKSSCRKKSSKRSKSSAMPCVGSPCLMCGTKQYQPRCCPKPPHCNTMICTRKPSPCRTSCPSSPACFALEEVTRDMRRRRRSASPCGRSSSSCGATKRRRSSSCPSSPVPRCSCSPCCPLPCCCKPPLCPSSCPPPLPCCPPARCPKPRPCPCLPPPLCKTCCHLCSAISKTPTPCCPPGISVSANNKPSGCRVGPGCPCPITCTKPCCTPTCFPTPKQPCKTPSPSAYNKFNTFRGFAMKSYTKSRDNDALCRQLMAKYKVTAPDSVPFCPKPRISTCASCDVPKKNLKWNYPSKTPIPGCMVCGGCSGCNNNKLPSSMCDTFENYGTSKQASSFGQHSTNAPIQFNTSPSHRPPRVEFRIPKRTPVECIKETGPRSPCKEFMTTFNFPKETKKYCTCVTQETTVSIEAASLSGDTGTPKSSKKSKKRSPSKGRKGGSKDRGQTSGDQDNISANRAMSGNTSDMTSSVISWRASTQRANATLKNKRSPKKHNVKSLAHHVKESHFDEEGHSSGLTPFKSSTVANETKYCSQKASCLISNILSPIQKCSAPTTEEKGGYDGQLHVIDPQNVSERPPNESAFDGRHCMGMKYQPFTKTEYPCYRPLSPLSQQSSRMKALQVIHRLNRKQLSPPSSDIFPSLKFSSASKTLSGNPILKSSFLFSKVAGQHDNNHTRILKSVDRDLQSKRSLTEGNAESTPSKDPCNATSGKTESIPCQLTVAEKRNDVAVGDDDVLSCLIHDTTEDSQCLTTESTEVESIPLLVDKFDRVEVNADGSMAQSKCNVFDYISVESSPANTSSAREDYLLSYKEELSFGGEEDTTEAEGDLLSFTEEKHEPVIELENQVTNNKEELEEMNNIGTAVDYVHHGDNVSKDIKADMIVTPIEKDASDKVVTSVNDHYHIPLFNFKFDLIPQKIDLMKFSDLVLAGESSVDPAEFGRIGESAVDPVNDKAMKAKMPSCGSITEKNQSNNNQTKDDEPDKDPIVADTSQQESDVRNGVQNTSNSNKPESDAPTQENVECTTSSDPKVKSALDELLGSSGVEWRKVTEASDVDLKIIRLGKTAINMTKRPVLPTTENCDGHGMPQMPKESRDNFHTPKEAERKPYMNLLKPGEIESSELSTNINELLGHSSSNQVTEYGTPV